MTTDLRCQVFVHAPMRGFGFPTQYPVETPNVSLCGPSMEFNPQLTARTSSGSVYADALP